MIAIVAIVAMAGITGSVILAATDPGAPLESAQESTGPMDGTVPAIGSHETRRVEGAMEGSISILGTNVGQASIPVDADPAKGNVTAVVIEVTWRADASGASELEIAYGAARERGSNPLRLDAEWAGSGQELTVSAPSVTVRQPFTVFVTIFYDQPVPAEFTALGGA